MEQVKKQVELYVCTPAGDIKVTSSPSIPPGELRIKLDPARTEFVSLQHVGGGQWSREYLGPWKETALHKCALCGVAVAGGDVGAHLVESLLAAHHAVCEKRPLEVGDYVEWKAVSTHVCGEVVGISKDDEISIRVDFDRHHPSSSSWQGEVHDLSRRQCGLRRIPRPGAGEQATSNPVRIGCILSRSTDWCWIAISDGGAAALRPGDRIGVRNHPDAPDRTGRATVVEVADGCARLERPAVMDIACIATDDHVYLIERSRGGQHDPALPRCACGEDHPPGKHAPIDPLDVVYDSRPLRELLAMDQSNRQEARETCAIFTPVQHAAVRSHWSAQLRAKVTASREAERNRVRVDLEYLPWE